MFFLACTTHTCSRTDCPSSFFSKTNHLPLVSGGFLERFGSLERMELEGIPRIVTHQRHCGVLSPTIGPLHAALWSKRKRAHSVQADLDCWYGPLECQELGHCPPIGAQCVGCLHCRASRSCSCMARCQETLHTQNPPDSGILRSDFQRAFGWAMPASGEPQAKPG